MGSQPSAFSDTVRPRVLLVDDDTRTARLLAHMLREDGFDVELAWDGAAAIGRLARAPMPDVLITDLRMPHVGGVAVTQYARSRSPRLPILILTGYPNMLEPSDLVPQPVVFTKPIDYERLAAELRRVSSPAAT
jgi:two-component system response regulator MprA